MKEKSLIRLFEQVEFLPKKAAEIGVYSLDACILRQYFGSTTECHLYEAVPHFCDAIEKGIQSFDNVVLNRFALTDYNGSLNLYLAGSSTFNSNQSASPAINHDNFNISMGAVISVPCRDFSEVDTGDYDFVSIDVEGGEYSILSRMKSRPTFISIETQSRDYINPKLGSISDWMLENNYRVWLWNDTDTVFCNNNSYERSTLDKLRAKWHNFRYFAGRL